MRTAPDRQDGGTDQPFSWIWVDGGPIRRDAFTIDPFDEGLLYGLGLFETTRTFEGEAWLWEEHCARLCAAADDLGIDVTRQRLPTLEQLAEFHRHLGVGDVVFRLSVTAGCAEKPGQIWTIARPLPPARLEAVLKVSPLRVSADDPLARHKSLNYGARLLARRAAAAAGADDALLIDPEGRVLEATTANIFLRIPSGWVTPALTGGVLAGTVRHRILTHLRTPVIEEMSFDLPRLEHVQEAFLTNSVHGIVPVSQIEDRKLQIGSETLQIREWLLRQR